MSTRRDYHAWIQENLHGAAPYYALFGAVIRQAIEDYQLCYWRIGPMKREFLRLENKSKRNSYEKNKLSSIKTVIHNYNSAKLYLFSPKWLESKIKELGMDDQLSITMIRQEAMNKKRSLNDNSIIFSIPGDNER